MVQHTWPLSTSQAIFCQVDKSSPCPLDLQVGTSSLTVKFPGCLSSGSLYCSHLSWPARCGGGDRSHILFTGWSGPYNEMGSAKTIIREIKGDMLGGKHELGPDSLFAIAQEPLGRSLLCSWSAYIPEPALIDSSFGLNDTLDGGTLSTSIISWSLNGLCLLRDLGADLAEGPEGGSHDAYGNSEWIICWHWNWGPDVHISRMLYWIQLPSWDTNNIAVEVEEDSNWLM